MADIPGAAHPPDDPSGSATEGAPLSSSTDPRLDFLSPQFDPHLALATVGLQPPNTRVRALDNLTHVAPLLPPDAGVVAIPPRPPRGPTDTQQAPTHQRKDYQRILAAREEAARPILQELVERITQGPLLLLRHCLSTKQRVRVVTRHKRGVRGVATGELWAFDKHMNMVLRNVEETYTVRLYIPRDKQAAPDGGGSGDGGCGGSGDGGCGGSGGGESSAGEEATQCVRLKPIQEHRQRTLRQVYVRGSSVVLVSVCGAEGATAGASGGG